MQKELEQKLAEEFPFMRRGETVRQQEQTHGWVYNLYDAFGIEAGSGWYELIRDLCREIVRAYEEAGQPVDVEIDQIKEKWGTLRFYWHPAEEPVAIHAIDGIGGGGVRFKPGTSEVHAKVSEIVDRYEERSAHVCEVCGAEGSLRSDLAWVQVLCDDHYGRLLQHMEELKARRAQQKKEDFQS